MKDLDKNLAERITLGMLAQKYCINKFHLQKEFKKFIGISPNEYAILNRISLSKELLKYFAIPVCEITFKIGIDNVSHFINLFKNREVVTPLAFMKKWQCKR